VYYLLIFVASIVPALDITILRDTALGLPQQTRESESDLEDEVVNSFCMRKLPTFFWRKSRRE
jgi:hypothetical protein